LIELFRHVIEFASKRVDVSDLVGGRFAFVTEDCSVKLVGVLTQTFLARDCAALGRGDDFLSHRRRLSVEIGDLLAKRIAFRQCGTRLGKRLSQAD
jgi:hypothetical protein